MSQKFSVPENPAPAQASETKFGFRISEAGHPVSKEGSSLEHDSNTTRASATEDGDNSPQLLRDVLTENDGGVQEQLDSARHEDVPVPEEHMF